MGRVRDVDDLESVKSVRHVGRGPSDEDPQGSLGQQDLSHLGGIVRIADVVDGHAVEIRRVGEMSHDGNVVGGLIERAESLHASVEAGTASRPCVSWHSDGRGEDHESE